MKTNTAMTIYNRYVEDRGEKYQRSVIDAVQWEDAKGSNVRATGGTSEANQANVYVLLTEVEAVYVKPKAFDQLEDKTGKLTFQTGDYIVKGIVEDEIEDDFTITTLKETYDDVLQISSVDTMDYGSKSMRHWELGAK